MIAPESLVHLFKPWADFYADSKGTETIVTFLHIGGLLLAGGFAIAMDRGTLRALRGPLGDRARQVRELGAIHRWVLTGLVLVVISGLAQLTADLDTFFGSWIFWTKMALVVLLLINGFLMTRAEQALVGDPSESSPHWRVLHRSAVMSLGLWFVITFAGVALINLA